jgi:hypothetical protein
MYLGVHGSEESVRRYRQFLRRLEGGTTADSRPVDEPDLTVDELILRYFEFAEGYYSHEGQPTKEFRVLPASVKNPLRLLGGGGVITGKRRTGRPAGRGRRYGGPGGNGLRRRRRGVLP